MGRMYTAVIDALALTAATEFIMLEAAADTVIIIHEVKFTQDASATSAQCKFMCYKTSTAAGTRGDAGTVNALNSGDPTFLGTCRQLIETGDGFSAEPAQIWSEAQNALNGLHILPTPEARPVISGGEGFTVKLETEVSLTWSGYIIFEELGKTLVPANP